MRKLGGRIECGRSCLYVLFLLLLFLFLCLALPRILLVALDATLVVICDVAAVFFRFSGWVPFGKTAKNQANSFVRARKISRKKKTLCPGFSCYMLCCQSCLCVVDCLFCALLASLLSFLLFLGLSLLLVLVLRGRGRKRGRKKSIWLSLEVGWPFGRWRVHVAAFFAFIGKLKFAKW